MSLDSQLATAFQGLQNSINQTFQTLSGNALIVNGGGTGSVGGEFIRKWTYDSSNSDTPAKGTFTVSADNTYISLNNTDTDGDATRWLNTLHGLLANTPLPILISMVDNHPTASIATAFILTAVDIGTPDIPYTKLYGTNLNISEPFSVLGTAGNSLDVNFIFNIEASASGPSGPIQGGGSNYSWVVTVSNPPGSGQISLSNGLIINQYTQNGTDSLSWFENLLNVVNGYSSYINGPNDLPLVFPPTNVILTLSTTSGVLIEFEFSQALPGISINGNTITLNVANPSEFLFANINNINPGDIITLAWTPLYSAPIAPVANQVGYTWNIGTFPPGPGTVVLSNNSYDLLFNSITTNGVNVLPWFQQLSDLLNGTASGPSSLPTNAVLNVSFSSFGETATFLINSQNTTILLLNAINEPPINEPPLIALNISNPVFQDIMSQNPTQLGNVITISWQPSYGTSGDGIRNWVFDSSKNDTPNPGSFSVDYNHTYITINNSDTDGSALRWINSLHGLFANTQHPVLISLVDDDPVATITTAFVLTGVEVGITVTKLHTTHIVVPFDIGKGVNFMFTIEAATAGATGPTGPPAPVAVDYPVIQSGHIEPTLFLNNSYTLDTTSILGLEYKFTPSFSMLYANAMSASGQYQFGAVNFVSDLQNTAGFITISSDYGKTISKLYPKKPIHQIENQPFSSIASSASGNYIVAGCLCPGGSGNTNNNSILFSNFGETIKAILPNIGISAVAISNTGQFITAVSFGPNYTDINNYSYTSGTSSIYVSHDYGETFKTVSIYHSWVSVKMSADGKYQTAIGDTNIFRSSDFGVTWVETIFNSGGQTGQNPNTLAMSGSGQYQFVSIYDLVGTKHISSIFVYISNDFGLTWATNATLDNGDPNNNSLASASAAMSYSGQYICMTFLNSTSSQDISSYVTYIYYSNDYGMSFTESQVSNPLYIDLNNPPPTGPNITGNSTTSVTMSQDAAYLVITAGNVSDYGVNIWTSITPYVSTAVNPVGEFIRSWTFNAFLYANTNLPPPLPGYFQYSSHGGQITINLTDNDGDASRWFSKLISTSNTYLLTITDASDNTQFYFRIKETVNNIRPDIFQCNTASILGTDATQLTPGNTYYFTYSIFTIPYVPAISNNWADPAPTTVSDALDRIAAALAAQSPPSYP